MSIKHYLIISVTQKDVIASVLTTKGLVKSSFKQALTIHQEDDISFIDPLELIFSVRSCINQVIKAKSKLSVNSIGIIVEEHLGLIWDKKTGAPFTKILLTKNLSNLQLNLMTTQYIKATSNQNFKECPLLLRVLYQTKYLNKDQKSFHDAVLADIGSWILYNLSGRKALMTSESCSINSTMSMQKMDQDMVLSEIGLKPSQVVDQLITKNSPETSGFVPLSDHIPIEALLSIKDANLLGMDCELEHNIVADLDYQGQVLFLNKDQSMDSGPYSSCNILSKNLMANVLNHNSVVSISK